MMMRKEEPSLARGLLLTGKSEGLPHLECSSAYQMGLLDKG